VSQRRFKLSRYLGKVMELHQKQKAVQQAGLHHIRVSHDDWCALLRGTGECNCNPDVEYTAIEGQN
jgi:hypothetical protein